MKMWKDMLTERVGTEKVYSQGRIYLLWSVLAYYITIGIITFKAMKPDVVISMEPLKVIIDALQWVLLLFAGYVFGGKTVEMVKSVMGKTTPVQPPANPEPNI